MIESQPLDICTEGLYSSYGFNYPMELQQSLFRHSPDLKQYSNNNVGVPSLSQGAKKLVQKKCKLSYCDREYEVRGYCKLHYTRKFIYKIPLRIGCIQCNEKLPIYKKKYCQRCRIQVKKEYSKNYCRELTKEKRREYNLTNRRSNLESIREHDRIRCRKRYPKRKEYERMYRQNNKEKIKEQNENWYKKNIAYVKERQKEYRKDYIKRDYVKIKYQKQNYIRRALTGDITEEQIKEIYERDSNRCVYCGSIIKLSLDHILPISKGGSSKKDNMVVACLSCNTSKNDRDVIDWCNMKGFDIPLIITILQDT